MLGRVDGGGIAGEGPDVDASPVSLAMHPSSSAAAPIAPPHTYPSNDHQQTVTAAAFDKNKPNRAIQSFGMSNMKETKAGGGVKLEWKLIEIHVGKTCVVDDVSGFALPGELVAIMGPSGSGKTTLLNMLSQSVGCGNDITKADLVKGEISINGRPVDDQQFTSFAYVRQNDLLMETLSARESIKFVCDILKRDLPSVRRGELCDRILSVLGLTDCSTRMIGGKHVKGISGGERKRTAIAVEIITNPSLILLDEPTSSLDSSTAEAVVLSLRELANEGRTVILSIHQPSHSVFKLFDRVIFLSAGKTAYFGAPDDAITHLKKLGFGCPPYTNPSEYFINILDARWTKSASTDTKARIAMVISSCPTIEFPKDDVSSPRDNTASTTHPPEKRNERAISTSLMSFDKLFVPSRPPCKVPPIEQKESTPVSQGSSSERKSRRRGVSWPRQLHLLCYRNIVNFTRQPKLLKTRLIKAICTGLLCGILFSNLALDQKSIRDRAGALFFLTLSLGMGTALDAVRIMPDEHPIVQKEFYHLYHPSAYYVSKVLTEVPFYSFQCLITSGIAYPLMGLQSSLIKFLMFYFIAFLSMETCDALGITIGCAFPSTETAAASASILMMPLVVFSGVLVSTASIPMSLRWISDISPFKYSLEAMLLNELHGLQLTCSQSEMVRGTICPFTTGDEALNGMFDLKYDQLQSHILILVIIMGTLRIIGLFALLYRNSPNRNKSSARKAKNTSK